MAMSMHLMTFKTPFGNNKAENQNLFLVFSVTDKKFRDCCKLLKDFIKTISVVIFGLVYARQSLKSIIACTFVFLFKIWRHSI